MKGAGLTGALILLNGCFLFGGGAASYSDSNIPENLKEVRVLPPPISDLHPYGPVGETAPGSWVRYRVQKGGAETVVTLGVVRKDGTGTWIEIVEEGEPRRASARRVSASLAVERALYREVAGGKASAVLPQSIEQHGEDDARDPGTERTKEVEIDVLGSRRKVTQATTVFHDEMLGKSQTDESWWLREVPPLYRGSPHGGLVRLSSPRDGVVIELKEMGSDYRPLIPDPK